jgi:RNA-directed DNA polymerase
MVQAVKHLPTGIKSGRKIAVDIDLSNFLDRVNPYLLIHKIGLKIKDKVLMRLIGRYLRARIVEHSKRVKPTQGLPQGEPLSTLLSHIMLDELDKTLEKREHHFARYADDFTILVKSQRVGERLLASISLFIQQTLKLVVNKKKSRAGVVEETKFLGFGFKYGRINIHDNSLSRFKYCVRALTNRN